MVDKAAKDRTAVDKATSDKATSDKATADKATETSWFIYLIRTRQGSLYTGITTDVLQRLAEHQGGKNGDGKKGAKYLRAKGPLQIVYTLEIGSRSLVSRAEYRLKRLSKVKKESIVVEQPSKLALLDLLKL